MGYPSGGRGEVRGRSLALSFPVVGTRGAGRRTVLARAGGGRGGLGHWPNHIYCVVGFVLLLIMIEKVRTLETGNIDSIYMYDG